MSVEGDALAEVYDDWYGGLEAGDCVAVLAEMANGGSALELGVGTGRVAVPLTSTGVPVHGVDNSAAMIGRLRAKVDNSLLETTIGDLTAIHLPRRFAVVYAVFNTVCSLTSQRDQVRCFAVAAEHLAPGGVFVVEAYVPDAEMISGSERPALRSLDVSDDGFTISVATASPVEQLVHNQTLVFSADGIRSLPRTIRWVWPSELDLMAKLAGLTLRERWAGWNRQPFDESSRDHVSVYSAVEP